MPQLTSEQLFYSSIFPLYLAIAFFPLPAIAQQPLPDLPEPVSNNAVARVTATEGVYLLSFMGMGAGKTYRDIHNRVWSLRPGDDHWQARQPVPSSLPLAGRLASVAVGIGDKAYIFGGYSVAEDRSETSSPDNFVYDVVGDSYRRITSTPVAVDDAVALAYQRRYIYLVSGWHNDGNVNLVQLYDTRSDTWQQATPFPGAPVFGHAGGIAGNHILVCDGVRVQARQRQPRAFLPEAACYAGMIDPERPGKIDWQAVPHPTGRARYRMAAAATNTPHPGVIFVGGTHNPYNYNGVGYDGRPSRPDNKLWYYSFSNRRWQVRALPQAGMDHRGLLKLDETTMVTVGGMEGQQRVNAGIRLINTSMLEP